MTRVAKPATEPSECRSCHRPVLWVEWRSGKKMPVDAQPATDGNVALTLVGGQYGKLVAEQYAPEKHAGHRRFVSHFSTCPNAASHRSQR